ncbi:MAG: tetratricopeptide repeat protein, partial [Chlamydiales bacterium]
YQKDQHEESAISFRWLVILNPFEIKYWMGLAANQQLLDQFEKALHSYAIASLLDQANPLPHYHAYECYESLNHKEDAKKALDLAYERAKTDESYKEIKSKIESKR